MSNLLPRLHPAISGCSHYGLAAQFVSRGLLQIHVCYVVVY